MAGVLRGADTAAAGAGQERAGGAPSARNLALAGPDSGAVDENRLLEWIARLAMGLCSARGAQLLKVAADGSATVVAAHGLPFQVESDVRQGPARYAIDLHSLGAGTRLTLLVDREAGSAFGSQEIRQLEGLGLIASNALARARSDADLRASHAIGMAVMSGVRDAMIALDAKGIVRAVSSSAAALVGRGDSEAIGKRLRDVPGLAPLARALSAGERGPQTVTLASGEVKLRLRRCGDGLAVTLVPAAAGAATTGGARFGIEDLIGESPRIQRARSTAFKVADSHLPVLITGETGTGKEILAQAIHNASARADQPFVGVNVSAIPRDLLESELFGYEAGAFTGARAQGHQGTFELAGSGTILLDEVGDMPLDMQAKLLRVLQERAVQRLGAARPRPISARVIASTNRDLEADVAEGRFRLDLLHRLRVVHVELPPLRERGNDIRLLVAHQLRQLAQSTGRSSIRVTTQVMEALEAYAWPGNVRELVNVLDFEVRMLPQEEDLLDAVPGAIERSLRASRDSGADQAMTLEAAERKACVLALQKTGGNVARAADLLGVVKATLYAKMRRYGIS
jgi:sigma-54 dependent transcriptional regulator, acetoin dehydrogenase operon transcriptional activator AcoR